MGRYGKFGNKKTVIHGIKFDSRLEATYYLKLCDSKKKGHIQGFKMQQPYILQPGFTRQGEKVRPIKYIADFVIFHQNKATEIIDVKGVQTAVFKLKWKMLKFNFLNRPDVKFTIWTKEENGRSSPDQKRRRVPRKRPSS